MYVVGYVIGAALARRRVRRGLVHFTEAAVDSLVAYLLIGMLLGARLVYVLVYGRAEYAAHPLDVFAIWHGGLSFHGAVLGMLAACAVFSRRHHVQFAEVTDTLAACGTPGLFFGRLGNFINGELYGRVTNVPWAMVFPTDPLQAPRHPSQLYEAVCEGLVLFGILRILESQSRSAGWYRPGLLSGAFLVGYGILRFLIEYTREPDVQLGFVLGALTMGQVLCALMIVAGVLTLFVLYRRPRPDRAFR
jgi:phosphatidylglycerol:prolipoprotein diacylglycerol transferase